MTLGGFQGILDQVKGHRDFDAAILAIRKLGEEGENLFPALWGRAIRRQHPGGHVLLCATALLRLNPNCPLSLEEALLDLGDQWDVSLEELPWYLASQFSPEAVKEKAHELATQSPEIANRMQTVVYWVEKL